MEILESKKRLVTKKVYNGVSYVDKEVPVYGYSWNDLEVGMYFRVWVQSGAYMYYKVAEKKYLDETEYTGHYRWIIRFIRVSARGNKSGYAFNRANPDERITKRNWKRICKLEGMLKVGE